MEQALREQFGDRLTWSQPKGGFFLWATLPEGYECEALLAKALEQGVHLRHRERVLRGRQRPRPHSPVVLLAGARAHSRGCEAPGGGNARDSVATEATKTF